MIFVLAAPRFCFVSLLGLELRFLKISCCLLLDLIGQGMYLEPVQSRYKLVCWSFWPILRVHHEKHVGEPCPKVSPISVVVPRRFWCVHIHTFRAVKLNHRLPRYI